MFGTLMRSDLATLTSSGYFCLFLPVFMYSVDPFGTLAFYVAEQRTEQTASKVRGWRKTA